MDQANIFVNFDLKEKTIDVKCVIAFEGPVTDFRFSLSTLLTVDTITADMDSTWGIIGQWQPRWQYRSNEIEILGKTPMKEITIAYHGQVSGWCNTIEERRIALSAYSAWTIFEPSVPIACIFKIRHMEDYFIVNARYDSSRNLWIYGETDHEAGNIIALKKGKFHAANAGPFHFYYLNEAEKEYADNYIFYYGDIMKYYSSILPSRQVGKMDVVSLDLESGGGAYFRKELMVIDKMQISEEKESIRKNTISLLAHELGHNWFFGADTETWEDWLNETGAGWAALLYVLSIDDQDLFDEMLFWAKEKYKDTPIIQSPDLNRPSEGVHIRGVMLFYEIYHKYGAETVKTVLQILAGLKNVSTDHFLLELKSANIDRSIPAFIEKGLTAKDYSALFHRNRAALQAAKTHPMP